MKRSQVLSFRANFEEVKILEAKKKQLRSKTGLGTLAKNLALTRNLPKNDNDIEFLNLMDFVFKELQKLAGEIDNDSYAHLRDCYSRISQKYEDTLNNTIE